MQASGAVNKQRTACGHRTAPKETWEDHARPQGRGPYMWGDATGDSKRLQHTYIYCTRSCRRAPGLGPRLPLLPARHLTHPAPAAPCGVDLSTDPAPARGPAGRAPRASWPSRGLERLAALRALAVAGNDEVDERRGVQGLLLLLLLVLVGQLLQGLGALGQGGLGLVAPGRDACAVGADAQTLAGWGWGMGMGGSRGVRRAAASHALCVTSDRCRRSGNALPSCGQQRVAAVRPGACQGGSATTNGGSRVPCACLAAVECRTLLLVLPEQPRGL